MSVDPLPRCGRENCGFPITGCRSQECINPKCRDVQLHQGVELSHKPVSVFEFLNKFDTEEPQWRSSSRFIDPSHGYEPPFKPARRRLESDDKLDSHAVPIKHEPWRAIHRYIPGSTGAFSESWRPCGRYIDPGHEGCSHDWRPSIRCFETCTRPPSELHWKSQIRCYNKHPGLETAQYDFHPTLRYIPQGEAQQPIWHQRRGPGKSKSGDKWVPEFRVSTPDIESKAEPGCNPWQCPRTGKRHIFPQNKLHLPFTCESRPTSVPDGSSQIAPQTNSSQNCPE